MTELKKRLRREITQSFDYSEEITEEVLKRKEINRKKSAKKKK